MNNLILSPTTRSHNRKTISKSLYHHQILSPLLQSYDTPHSGTNDKKGMNGSILKRSRWMLLNTNITKYVFRWFYWKVLRFYHKFIDPHPSPPSILKKWDKSSKGLQPSVSFSLTWAEYSVHSLPSNNRFQQQPETWPTPHKTQSTWEIIQNWCLHLQ